MTSRLGALLAELIGTFFLLVGVVGSGIMATRLTDDVALQLLANSIATAFVRVALILMFAATSGAHFNPAVTLVDLALGGRSPRDAAEYIVAQIAGGVLGVIAANVMFELDAISFSTTDRSSPALWLAEVIATIGLLLVIFGIVRKGDASTVAYAVGAYIGAAYWFTSSTSFANPAVTIARMFSDTFAGIEPASAPMFVLFQLVGTGISIVLIKAIWPNAQP